MCLLVSNFLEGRLIDFVLGDLRRDATPRHTADLGAAADVAVAFLERFTNELLFNVSFKVYISVI